MGSKTRSISSSCVLALLMASSIWALLSQSAHAFSSPSPPTPPSVLEGILQTLPTTALPSSSSSRRNLLTAPSIMLLSLMAVPEKVPAAMQNTQTVFKPGETLSLPEAKERFRQGQQSLQELAQNYDDIVAKGGGDNVRRYLGTVGTTSGLYGIQKVLRILQSEADDVVEYTESMADFEYYLSAADTAVYSANFVEYSSAKTKPEKFFADARKAIDQMKVTMESLAKELNL